MSFCCQYRIKIAHNFNIFIQQKSHIYSSNSNKKRLMFLLYCLFYLITLSNSYVLLYHTENSPSAQYFDCIDYINQENSFSGVKYCRQRNEVRSLQRDFKQSCYNSGQLWTFEKLSEHNISSLEVLKWSSSIEQTDRYAKYLLNHSLDREDHYICNCTNLSTFGKFCEYEFYHNNTLFQDAIIEQFEPLRNMDIHLGSQLHNNRPCYMMWTCDSGSMCLDWRHICDGDR